MANLDNGGSQELYYKQHAMQYASLLQYLLIQHNGPMEFDKAVLTKQLATGQRKLRTQDRGDRIVIWLE